ncbi:aspartate dehydrogenase domain-containing protein [Rhizobium sp. SYY.PMSO]|uniref:aspartate dehydrogenase domain-containing protein n=1 Tax=Rhizobium sp. SYY.PMSO TaxID=3382192 RepID=UPI000DE374FB
MTAIEPTTVGLIGFGTLARQLVAALPDRTDGPIVRWIALLREGSTAAIPSDITVVRRLEDMVATQPCVVVEAAGQESVAACVPALLRSGISVIVASVGALADETTAAAIAEARRQSGARLVMSSGAIGGLDYLAAVAGLADTRVVYRLKKPVAAWCAELGALGLAETTQAVTLFEGTPAEAARLYPKNLNAAFTAMLAVQPARITVSVVADPGITANIHEIDIESAAGTASFRFANTPSYDNPKTSAVTALSLAAAVRNFLDKGVKA